MAVRKFLDDVGAAQLNTILANKFNTKADASSVPTKLTDLTNDGNFVQDADYVHTDSNYTATEKTKLGGIAAGAQVNVLEKVKVNNVEQTITSKAVNITVPTNNNQLTNGAGYQTASDVTTAINTALAGITSISYQVVSSLPATGEAGVIYLVANSGTSPNVYDEYIWVNNAFEKIGTTAVDLSNYMQFSDMVPLTSTEITNIFTLTTT